MVQFYNRASRWRLPPTAWLMLLPGSRFNLIFVTLIIISFKGVLKDIKTTAKNWRGKAARFNQSYILGLFHCTSSTCHQGRWLQRGGGVASQATKEGRFQVEICSDDSVFQQATFCKILLMKYLVTALWVYAKPCFCAPPQITHYKIKIKSDDNDVIFNLPSSISLVST